MKIAYPARLEPQPEGGYCVSFPDLPEAITEGENLEEARFNAQEVLELVLEFRMEQGEDIPLPSRNVQEVEWVEPAAAVQSALLVHLARKESGRTLADLARALGTSWPAVKRLENPRHSPTLRQLERAAAALGKRLVLSFEDNHRAA